MSYGLPRPFPNTKWIFPIMGQAGGERKCRNERRRRRVSRQWASRRRKTAATSAAAVVHNDATTSAYGMSIAAAARCRLVVVLVLVDVDVDVNILLSAPLSADVPSAQESSAAAAGNLRSSRKTRVTRGCLRRGEAPPPCPFAAPQAALPRSEAPFASFCPRSPLRR